jgi:hypothetical protein
MTADRARSDAKALRAMLAEQSEQAAAGVLQTGGQVSAERLDGLARLARLVEMREAATKPVRNRWAVPLVAIVTVACMSVLLFARVRSTEVEMDLQVSELSFVVPVLQVITNALSVSALRVSGLRAIELPGGGADSLAAGPGESISLDPAPTAILSLDPSNVPAGARILRKADGAASMGCYAALRGWLFRLTDQCAWSCRRS